MDWFKFGTIVGFGVTMTAKVLYRWYDLAVKNTLKRCNKWLPYIFCACSENKKSSYKILILWEKPRLCRDCKLSRFKITGRSCQDKVKKRYTHFKKSHFWCDINYCSNTLSIYILISLKLLITALIWDENLEDLKVLRRSPDLLNNVKIGQGQLQLLIEQILFLPYTFWSSDLNNLMNNQSNSPVISEKKMFR